MADKEEDIIYSGAGLFKQISNEYFYDKITIDQIDKILRENIPPPPSDDDFLGMLHEVNEKMIEVVEQKINATNTEIEENKVAVEKEHYANNHDEGGRFRKHRHTPTNITPKKKKRKKRC